MRGVRVGCRWVVHMLHWTGGVHEEKILEHIWSMWIASV